MSRFYWGPQNVKSTARGFLVLHEEDESCTAYLSVSIDITQILDISIIEQCSRMEYFGGMLRLLHETGCILFEQPVVWLVRLDSFFLFSFLFLSSQWPVVWLVRLAGLWLLEARTSSFFTQPTTYLGQSNNIVCSKTYKEPNVIVQLV